MSTHRVTIPPHPFATSKADRHAPYIRVNELEYGPSQAVDTAELARALCLDVGYEVHVCVIDNERREFGWLFTTWPRPDAHKTVEFTSRWLTERITFHPHWWEGPDAQAKPAVRK